MEDLLKTPPKVINNAWNDDYWGATSNIADVTPFGRDIKNLLKKLGFTIEDKPNIKEISAFDRALRATGGLIKGEGEVPNAKEKPEERINPFTGEPYTALYYNGGAVRKQYNDGGSEGKKVNIVEKVFLTKNPKDILTRTVKDQEGYKFQLELEDDGEGTILRNKKHNQFVRDMYIALKEKGHPFPEAAATHAGYESRYGASALAQETNNVFGLKKKSEVDEPYKEYDTREKAKDGSSYIEKKAKFRTFNTIGDSIDGYMEHINNRGKTAPHSEQTPKQWRSAQTDREYYAAIQKDGYATETSYPDKLLTTLNDFRNRGVFDLTN